MNELKTVGIKELKNNLSAYLRDVRSGIRILISDRNIVVAEICRPFAGAHGAMQSNPILNQWVDNGIVSLPTAPKEKLPLSPIKSPSGTALKLLDKERTE